MQYLGTFVKRFLRHQQGVALIEMVFVMPMLLLLVLGGAELTRYVLISQKIDKAAYALADVISQSAPSGAGSLTESSVVSTLNMYDSLMRPFDNQARQAAIVTSVQRCSGNNRVLWQAAGGGVMSNGQTLSIVNGLPPSAIGPAVRNTNATFPGSVSSQLVGMLDEENMIVMEVFYSYRPFLADALFGLFEFSVEPTMLIRRAYLHPRNGTLNCLLPGFACVTCNAPPSPPVVPGNSCPAPDCAPGSLGGAGVLQPCDCTPNGEQRIGYTGGPNGCGRYRCSNGNWQLIVNSLCHNAPQCQ